MRLRILSFLNIGVIAVVVFLSGSVASFHLQAQEAAPSDQAVLAKAKYDDDEQNKTREEARRTLDVVGQILKSAKVSRATVELTTRSKIGTEVVQSQQAVYQIASAAPNLYTAYLKASDQSFRVFCDGNDTFVLVSPAEYYKVETEKNLKNVVKNLPAPLGPYPEPVMALTLCGVDPAESLMTDMESVQVIDREPYANKPAVHLRGMQVDGVVWDLWLGTEKSNQQPLRMLVDLTEVIGSGDDVQLPEDFSYELEFLFTLWRTTGESAPDLFRFTPPQGSTEYESLDDYYESLSTAVQRHPLRGMPAPDFEAELLSAKEKESDAALSKVKLSDLKGEIVVLDFWATWCGPCINAMPVIDAVTKKFADRGVKFYAVNTGETEQEVRAFLEKAEVKPDVILDPTGTIADQFKTEAIPQTVIIGKDGVVQMIHVGYSSLEALEKELGEQLEVLASGGSLITEQADTSPESNK